jgi:hypothetical protein
MTPMGAYTSRCRTCGREIAAEAASCPHCGAANLEERCPHCGAVTTSSPDKELRSRCDLCGGPRIPRGDPGVKRVRRETAHLRRANEARKARARYRGISAAFGAIGAFSTLIALLGLVIFPISFAYAIAWAVFAVPSILLVLWAAGRASAKTKEIAPAIDQAWTAAAGEVASRLKGPFTAQKLAQVMGIEEALAEELLAQLDANDVVRSDVTDAGEMAYQLKYRVGAEPSPGDAEAEAEALAEAEAGEAAAGARLAK